MLKFFFFPSETPTVQVTASRNTKVGFGNAHAPLLDRTLRVCSTSNSCSPSEVLASRDPLTCEESAISTAEADFHVEDGKFETEVMACTLYAQTFLYLVVVTHIFLPELDPGSRCSSLHGNFRHYA